MGECEPAWGNLVGFFRILPPQRWTGETRGPFLGRRTFSPDFGGRVAVTQARLCYSSSLNACHVQGCFDAEKFLFPPQTYPPCPETWGFPKEKKKRVGFLLNLLSHPLHPTLGLNPCFFTVPAELGSHHVFFVQKHFLFLNLDKGGCSVDH